MYPERPLQQHHSASTVQAGKPSSVKGLVAAFLLVAPRALANPVANGPRP